MTAKPPIRLKFKDPSKAVEGSDKPESRYLDVSRVETILSASLDEANPVPKKVPPPSIGTERVTVKCGHTIVFDLYAKDPFRDPRRAKAVSRDCPGCRQARAHAEVTAGKERRAKKGAPFAKSLKPRLPDGSRFVATYDATAVQWTGTLTVDGVTFSRQGASLNKLLYKLDDVYRATKATTP